MSESELDITKYVVEAIANDLEVDSSSSKEESEPKIEAEVEKPIELGANQKKYSDLFGKSFTGHDHALTVFERSDWPEEIHPFLFEPDSNYIIQPEAAEKLAVAIEQGDKTVMVGPTGAGKSSLVKEVCARLGRPYIRINMTGDMETSAFFGQLTVEDGATVWKDGPATEAVKMGAVCLIDEWDVTPPEIMMGLQWLLEDHGRLYLKEKPGNSEDKMLAPHPEFRIVCGGNTIGQGDERGDFAGTTVQNSATLDRFQTVIKMDYMGRNDEIKMVTAQVPQLPHSTAKQILQFADLVRTSYKQQDSSLTMSPRTLINWARKTVYWGDPVAALKVCFYDKVVDSEKGNMEQLVKKVFGKGIK